jgi:hypothetical protein
MVGIIINNLIKEETVASQCSPLDSTVFAELQCTASSSHSCNSDQNLRFDILTLAHFIGPPSVNMHKPLNTMLNPPSTHQGHTLSKHSLPLTLFSTGKNGHTLTKIDDSSLDLAASIQITWRIQKNCQNGQKIKFSAGTKNPAICLVWGALQ